VGAASVEVKGPDAEGKMISRILVPLDGSKTAEKVLPYARALAGKLKTPVDLMAAIDITEVAAHISAGKAYRFLDEMVEDNVRQSERYLRGVADTFKNVPAQSSVKRGRPEEAIIEKAAADKGTLIAMATHGRSGLNRWLLGSVAEKVLRGAKNPLLLVRALEESSSDGEAVVKSVIVPLDGSELAESVLPVVVETAKILGLEVILFRAYSLPHSVYAAEDGGYAVNYDELIAGIKGDAEEYLEAKTEELKKQGIEKVSWVTKEGFSADEIITFGRATPDNLVAMCTHGRSGVRRWMLGSVTETVVRHCGDPVLVLRGA